MPQTEQQRQNAFSAAGYNPPTIPTGLPTISSESLKETPSLNIPPTPPQRDYSGGIDAGLQSLLQSFNAQTEQETTSTDLQSRVLSSIERLGGQTAKKQQLEQEAGLPGQRQDLQNVINQLQGLQKEAQAIPLQIQEEFKGVGATSGGAAPIQASRLRENAIKSLGLAAIGQTLQGNISLAEQSIQSALDAEFEPVKTELEVLKQAYTFNKEALERIDKKRADNLNIVLNERTRLLGLQEADKKEIYNIGMTAAQYGADAGTVQKIIQARNREEALSLAGSFLQDPAAKQALENAKLDNLLTRTQINKTNYELGLLQKYGGMTPAQYTDFIKAERKEIEAVKDISEKSRLEGISLQEKLGTISGILNSSALSSAVGTSYLTRAPQGIFGNIGAFVGLGAGSVLEAGAQKITGEYQNFIASVEQLASQEFIDTLIDAKAQGAVFGALNEQEGNALRAASTKIGSFAVKDKNGKVTHYNTGEAQFKKEIETIQALTKTAYQRVTGSSWLPDEQDFWDNLEISQASTNFSPVY